MFDVPRVRIDRLLLLMASCSISLADDRPAANALDSIVAADMNAMDDGKKLVTEEEFGTKTGTAPGRLNATKELIQEGIEREIWHLGRVCELSDEQLAKLRLSKKGQFQKWLDDVEQLRQKYEGKRLDRDERFQAEAEFYCLRHRITSFPLNPDCFFQRVLRNVLTKEQQPHFTRYYEARQRERLDRVWAYWESVAPKMTLSIRTRENIADLLLTKAPPLAKNGEYAHTVVLLQLDQIRTMAEPLMQRQEWSEFEASLAKAKAFELLVRQMELWPIPSTVSADPTIK